MVNIIERLTGTISFVEYEKPHQIENGEWVYLYSFKLSHISFNFTPQELTEWEMLEEKLQRSVTSKSLSYDPAWYHINKQFEHVEFCQREAGSIKCWQITLPERDDDLILSEIVRMKLMFG